MSTASTSTAVAMDTNAHFITWVQEILTQLITTCGITQLPDTGQITTSMGPPVVNAALTIPSAGSSAGYVMLAYNDTLSKGPISTVNIVNGGTGYDGGATHTYTTVPLTGGTGSGAQATVVVTSGVVTAVTITAAGTGYLVGDALSASNTNLGGSGSGLSVTVGTLTSAASPAVIKLEFGLSSNGTGYPQMWITVGSGTNGAGTVQGPGGVTTVRCVLCYNTPLSTSTSYTSRFVWNSTYGYLALVWKIGASFASYGALGGFVLFRSNNSSGAATGDSINLITNSYNTSAQYSTGGYEQCLSFLTNTVYPPTASNGDYWLGTTTASGFPFGLTTTTYAGNSYLIPIYYMTPVLNFSAYNCVALQTEVAVGSTCSSAIVGSTALTFLSVGYPFGCGASYLGSASSPNSSFCILWQ